MTVRPPRRPIRAIPRRLRGRVRAAALPWACALLALAGGCSTGRPAPIKVDALAETQTFPYFRVYWVGPTFDRYHLSAADGLRGYRSNVGPSVYYGDCVHYKGIFGGGSCLLPLQVTTVIYRVHSNATLGPQRNVLLRGVPAVVYDEGRSIELYTGRLAIDIFSDEYSRAVAATGKLLPINAPGSAEGDLPPPVYCPGLSGRIDAQVNEVMERLPGRVCQRARAQLAYAKTLGAQ
jgi:hypothetical protein